MWDAWEQAAVICVVAVQLRIAIVAFVENRTLRLIEREQTCSSIAVLRVWGMGT